MRTEVLIVGGGLSGLHTAYKLAQQGIDFILIEARDRLGGRILSYNADGASYRGDQAGYDFGPTWFWPGQARMEGLVRELDLVDSVFTQYGSGDALYEDERSLSRGIAGISMAGSYRLKGGMRQIIAALEQRIAAGKIRLGSRLARLRKITGGLHADVVVAGKSIEIEAKVAVMALPPRLAIDAIEMIPALSQFRESELSAIPTWMAGHAKVIAIYREAFWREQGFSGDVISQRGPLREIHDASPAIGGPFALFGFLGIPAAQRFDRDDAIIPASVDQMERLFGDSAKQPLDVFIKDWARDTETATEYDQEMSNVHSLHRLRETAEFEWDRQIIWSGSEAATSSERNGGFLEGAIESSQATLQLIQTYLAVADKAASAPPG